MNFCRKKKSFQLLVTTRSLTKPLISLVSEKWFVNHKLCLENWRSFQLLIDVSNFQQVTFYSDFVLWSLHFHSFFLLLSFFLLPFFIITFFFFFQILRSPSYFFFPLVLPFSLCFSLFFSCVFISFLFPFSPLLFCYSFNSLIFRLFRSVCSFRNRLERNQKVPQNYWFVTQWKDHLPIYDRKESMSI